LEEDEVNEVTDEKDEAPEAVEEEQVQLSCNMVTHS
jgi:hypothetical protein